MAMIKGDCRNGWVRCACCGRLFRINGSDNRHRHQKYCKNPICLLERSRRYKRDYARKRYHSDDKTIARMLNLRTTASRKKTKARKLAEAETAAIAQAEKEALERKAAEEVERAHRESQDWQEMRDLQFLGLQAMLFGVKEACEMDTVYAKTLEMGRKWRQTMASKDSLSIFSPFGYPSPSGKAGAGFERAPPGGAKSPPSNISL